MASVDVESSNVEYTRSEIRSKYVYQTTRVLSNDGRFTVVPVDTQLEFKTVRDVPKLGVMFVGWGGNNGTTFTGAQLANKHKLTWNTKDGTMDANWFGSLFQASTVSLGFQSNESEAFVRMRDLLPLAHPDELAIDGWDISSRPLEVAMRDARVFDFDLQQQLKPYMEAIKPRKAIYRPDFIAANQEDRADNVIIGTASEQLMQVRADIKQFKADRGLDQVIVLWTANTERFCNVLPGVHDSAANLLTAIDRDESEVSASTLYAVAAILEGCSYVNGAPQNTLVPAVLQLAKENGVFVGGDDFKSGQTKVKSVLVDFLVSAGIKPTSIVSYNHLGNNDGKNLSAPKQFRSKEISKSNVVDDMIASNPILYPSKEDHPDHVVVIKYVPYVGDSKRAMDEYTSEIMMHGKNTLVLHNTCEDSLLATPIMLDLILLTELCQRITVKVIGDDDFQPFHSVLTILSFLLKAPLVPDSSVPVVNAYFKQRACIENIMRACIGLPPVNNMQLEHKLCDLSAVQRAMQPQVSVDSKFDGNVLDRRGWRVSNMNGINSDNKKSAGLVNGVKGDAETTNGYVEHRAYENGVITNGYEMH